MGLDPDSNQPAYLLGRAFAVLESLDLAAAGLQRDAATSEIFGRHFSSAVGEPALVVRWVGQHRPKLTTRMRARNSAAADRYAAALDDLLARLPDGLRPMKGDAAAQGAFLLGYHHQRARDICIVLTTAEVAERYGYASAAAARSELSRLGVRESGRDPQTGAKLWPVDDIERKRAEKPGRGVGGGRPRAAGRIEP